MKIAYHFLLFLLISMFLFGCGNKTVGIEGKIVDGKGKPLPGVTIIFKQVQPTQGYEQFEAKTGADGSFSLMGAAPSSDYILTVLSDKWRTKLSKKIKTTEGGQNLVLREPIKVRFNQIKDGSIIDTKTGLQWFIYPVSDVTAANAIETAKNIKQGGFTDWRLPSRDELAGLQDKIASKAPGTEPALVNKTCCAWVAEPNSTEVDWKFYVEEDNDLWASSKISPDNRVVVVRVTSAAVTVPAAAPTPIPQVPAVAQPSPAQTPVAVSPVTPAAKPVAGIHQASRKACAEKNAQAAKTGKPAAANSPAPAPAAMASAGKIGPAKVVSLAQTRTTEPVKASAPGKMSEPSLTESLYFEAASTALKGQELAKLKAFVAKIKGGKGSLFIYGHSDTSANSATNLLLSAQRSSSVIAALNKMGLSKDIKLELRVMGDGKPAASNDTPEGRKLNRRVEVSYIPE